MEKIKTWNRLHAFALLLGIIGIIVGRQLHLLTGIASISFGYFIYIHFELLKKYRPIGGYAFWLTLFRLVIILALSWNFSRFSDIDIFYLALLAMLADGVDGWLARRFKTDSDFGAYFDMESDALFVCIMAGILYLKSYFGWWILGIGFLRYIYVSLVYVFKQDHKKEPPNKYASIIAGFLFISLLTPFLLEYKFYYPIVMLASVLVTLSFSYSFWKLIEQK